MIERLRILRRVLVALGVLCSLFPMVSAVIYAQSEPDAVGVMVGRLDSPVDPVAARILRGWLGEAARNVHPVGRNGMHRYNNQDHSMYTAMLTVENLVNGADHDVWEVNVDEDYHEERKAGGA